MCSGRNISWVGIFQTRYVLTGQIPPTLEIWPWVKVMTHSLVMDNNYMKYNPHLSNSWKVMVRKKMPCVNCDLDLGDMTLSQGHDKIVWYIITIHFGSEELWPGHGFWVCVHCDLDIKRYDLELRSWHTLRSWTISVWNIIQIQLDSEELWPWHGFSVC